jgi:mannitol/fructose-specific phosphotransferase system IIA component (Ntr-type)
VRIADFISEDAIRFRLAAIDVGSAIAELSAALAPLSGLSPQTLRDLFFEREHLGSTALGDEVACPHAKADVESVVGVFGIAEHGIDFRAPDRKRSRIIIAFVSPRHGAVHLRALAAVGEALSDEQARARLLEAPSAHEIYEILCSLAPSHR